MMTREEAIQNIKRMIGFSDTFDKSIFTLFPELKENEDERIRKAIVALIEDIQQSDKNFAGVELSDMLAYLEKQKINTEGDFGRGYDCGYKACLNSHGAEFFEKQKERNMDEWLEDGKRCYEKGKADAEQKEQKHRWENYIPTKKELDKRYEDLVDKIHEHHSTREKIISRATSEKQVVLISESSGEAEIGWDTRSLEDAKKLFELKFYSMKDNHLQKEQESVAERFAKIIRGNLIGIDKEVQQKFEQLYFEVTGNKMYGGYND